MTFVELLANRLTTHPEVLYSSTWFHEQRAEFKELLPEVRTRPSSDSSPVDQARWWQWHATDADVMADVALLRASGRMWLNIIANSNISFGTLRHVWPLLGRPEPAGVGARHLIQRFGRTVHKADLQQLVDEHVADFCACWPQLIEACSRDFLTAHARHFVDNPTNLKLFCARFACGEPAWLFDFVESHIEAFARSPPALDAIRNQALLQHAMDFNVARHSRQLMAAHLADDLAQIVATYLAMTPVDLRLTV